MTCTLGRERGSEWGEEERERERGRERGGQWRQKGHISAFSALSFVGRTGFISNTAQKPASGGGRSGGALGSRAASGLLAVVGEVAKESLLLSGRAGFRQCRVWFTAVLQVIVTHVPDQPLAGWCLWGQGLLIRGCPSTFPGKEEKAVLDALVLPWRRWWASERLPGLWSGPRNKVALRLPGAGGQR